MKNEIGPQYPRDKTIDKTGFLEKARLHQSKYRANIIKVTFDKYGNYLTKEDAKRGVNFYNDFEIFKEVKKRYPKYSKSIYANMLRSEHISFNLFIPLKKDLVFGKKLLNNFFGNTIKTIDKIEIEYAPSPANKYLNDKTSFDTYIEYTHMDNQKGIIGIEVKYTEHGYKLKPGSKEESFIIDKKSRYYEISSRSNIYIPGAEDLLILDKFRQIWRNQLLGESVLIQDGSTYKHFTSCTVFPSGNVHFVETCSDYIKLLSNNDKKFLPITFEDFFSTGKKLSSKKAILNWLNYMEKRYIVGNSQER